MLIRSLLKETAKSVDRQINIILKSWQKEVADVSVDLIPLTDAFIKANQGGKRIRGFLLKLGYELARKDWIKGKWIGEILKIAAAYEIFHTSILSHDDIIDQSPKRRGRPSLYKALGGGHHGISQAISLADCGFFIAVKVISESNFSRLHKIQALNYFAKTVMDTGVGEILDVELPYLNKRSENDVIKIMELKTARYTISAPLNLGAILAGAGEKLLGELGEFGENLGIAFQIQDDILGVFGSAKKIGKSVASDIEEGKNTLLIIEALKRVSNKQRRILKKYYGKRVTKVGLKKVREVFIDTKALDCCQEVELKYTDKAKMLIPKLTTNIRMQALLNEMVDYMVNRKK